MDTRSPQKHISIATIWVLHPSTQVEMRGGVERYCHDLTCLLTDNGYEVTIFQKATSPFSQRVSPRCVVEGINARLTFVGNRQIYKALCQKLSPDDPIIFLSQELLLGNYFRRSLAVNHGIWWDGDYPLWKKIVIKELHTRLLRWATATLCVDTAYINWCHSELPGRPRYDSRLKYIPNYSFDARPTMPEFRPPGSARSFRILFPRRITEAKIVRQGLGAELFLKAALVLKGLGYQPTLYFVGPNSQRDYLS